MQCRSATPLFHLALPASTSSSRPSHPRQDAWAFKDVPPIAASAPAASSALILPTVTSTIIFSLILSSGSPRFFYCRQQEGTEAGVFDDFYGTKGTCAINSAPAMNQSENACAGRRKK